MNALLQTLLTLSIVGGGLVIYHVLASEDPAPATDAAAIERDDDALEARIAALETREPTLRGTVDPQDLWDRVRQLEARVEVLEQPSRTTAHRLAPPPESPTSTAVDEGTPPGDLPIAVSDGKSPLSGEQEKRVKDLVDDAMSNRFRGRMTERLNRTLGELGIELTEDQRKKLDEAMSERFQNMREVWREGRQNGLSREEMGPLMAEVNAKFTEKVSDFIPARDAEAITAATMRGPGGPGGGGRRGP